MKKNWRNSVIILVVSIIIAACSSHQHAEDADTYTCPMHPTVVSDRPGTCPVCGMDLVRKARPGEEVQITDELARLIKSPNEIVTDRISTVKGEFKSRDITVTVTGVVTYDTRRVSTIPARIGGRLEKVYLTYAYQPVQKGQKVAEIYSPDLVTAQRELIYLIENDPGNHLLIDAAKKKLSLLGATEKQVDEIAKKKEAVYTFPIYSAQAGFVVRESQNAPGPSSTTSSAPSAGMNEMGGGASNGASTQLKSTASGGRESSELIKAGAYVSSGQVLFKVIDTQSLWVELNVPVSQSGEIQRNDDVELDFGAGEMKHARVDFVQPFFNEGSQFNNVRVYVSGSDLYVGQLAKASITRRTNETLWLPKNAVMDLGDHKIVFVKERETFKPKNITTGILSGDWIEVTQGLLSADEVATNAQYLVDSESFIKSK